MTGACARVSSRRASVARGRSLRFRGRVKRCVRYRLGSTCLDSDIGRRATVAFTIRRDAIANGPLAGALFERSLYRFQPIEVAV